MRTPPLVSRIVLLMGVTVTLTGCYVVSQGVHLVGHQIGAKPIERVAEPTPAERELFERVEDIRLFAGEHLGLQPGESYTIYRRIDSDHLVEVVSAARRTSFERKEWWFPIVGLVPYRGYYRPQPAHRLAARLRSDGWDVWVREVDAFSTLGFFRDPLYSFMADYSHSRLAELIIHESAHATLWVNGQAQFNEEFATFVGREGSEAFIRASYGADSPELSAVVNLRADRQRFRTDVLALKGELRDWYEQSRTLDRPEGEVIAGKRAIIESAQRVFARTYDESYRTEAYRGFAELEINNAWLDLFGTYTGNLERFEELHRRLGGDLPTTIGEIRARVARWEAQPRSSRVALIEVLDR